MRSKDRKKVPRRERAAHINSLACWKKQSIAIVSVGIDLTKRVLVVHGAEQSDKRVSVRPSALRVKLLEPIASLAPSQHEPVEAVFGLGHAEWRSH